MNVVPRQIKVAFTAVNPKAPSLPIWVTPNRLKWDEMCTAQTLLPIRLYLKDVLAYGAGRQRHVQDQLPDRRMDVPEVASLTDEHLVSWRDLSGLGWSLAEGQPSADSASSLDRQSYWTVFFAQNVMRGALTRLIETELQALERDVEGEVFWKPMVEGLRAEVRAYRNIPPLSKFGDRLYEHSRAMWQRVLPQLSDANRKNLEQYLASRKGDVRKIGER